MKINEAMSWMRQRAMRLPPIFLPPGLTIEKNGYDIIVSYSGRAFAILDESIQSDRFIDEFDAMLSVLVTGAP